MDTILKKLESSLQGTVQKFHEELQSVRSNRPSVGLVEDVKVDYYGQIMPIKALGSLSIRPPRDIEINIWDKGAMAAVMKAIEGVHVGLSTTNDGNVIRVTLPSLSEERRQEFIKLVKKMAEATRIQVRNHREDGMKSLKADPTINEDQQFKAKDRVQKIVDDMNSRIESLLEAKIKELSE